MGDIQQQAAAFGSHKGRQSLGTAVTADAHLTWQISGNFAQAGQAVDVLRRQAPGNDQRIANPTQ